MASTLGDGYVYLTCSRENGAAGSEKVFDREAGRNWNWGEIKRREWDLATKLSWWCSGWASDS